MLKRTVDPPMEASQSEIRSDNVWITLPLPGGRCYDAPAVIVKRDGWGPTVYRQTGTGTLRTCNEVLCARPR